MKVMVTGSHGFVGPYVCHALKQAGEEVVPFDLKLGHDLLDQDALEYQLRGVDAVVHLAANTDAFGSIERPTDHVWTNVMGTTVLLDAMLASGVSKVVMASSAAVYPGMGRVREAHADLPSSTPYGASKLAMETIASSYAVCRDLGVVCLRFGNMYGAGDRLASLVIEAQAPGGPSLPLYFGGSHIRDWLYVGDAADAVLASLRFLEQASPCFRRFNVSGGQASSFLEFVTTIETVTGAEARKHDGGERVADPMWFELNTDEIEAELDWHPSHDVEAGIRAMLEVSHE